MKLSHDEIGNLLPEYHRGLLHLDEMRSVTEHLSNCAVCTDTLSLLRKFSEDRVPDPGDLFWNTLPVRIRVMSAEQKRPGLFEKMLALSLPVAAAVALAIIATIVLRPGDRMSQGYDPFFRDPLEYSLLEFEDFSERRIGPPGEGLSAVEADLLEPADFSYHREFMSLSSTELGRLCRTLSEKDQEGG